ncbi:hypothetical protein MVEN_00904300 [Mycena venus]|uniref:Uncharacterized protein n=1 Tax=Mycena venus TaxID=2733690 RepID=A0A8H6YHV8_9AGAR|nr:hypothetical protein MVEN_00904300 [Mycena venus]
MASVHTFQPPGLTVTLSLGHKYRGWYLLFAHAHPFLTTREVARLDAPAPRRARSRSRRRTAHSGWSPRPRFWFDPHARSGWEAESDSESETLLDLLLALDLHHQPLFAVVDHDFQQSRAPISTSKVEVLVPEHQLAHYCEGCGRWELAGDDALRWYMVRNSDALPGYLCPSCHTKDWLGARLLRSLHRILSYAIC